MCRLNEDEIFSGVFVTSNLFQERLKGQLCARLKSRGLYVVNFIDKCRVVVVIITTEYLLSRYCMRELGAIVRSKRKIRIIPVFLTVGPQEWESLCTVCFGEWHHWADASLTEKQEWSRALKKLKPGDGLCFANQVIDLTMIVDAVCKVVPDKYSTLEHLTRVKPQFLEPY